MEFIEAKTILQRATHGEEWFGIDYNMNLYKGCCHKCIYCDSRSNCYQVEDFDRVRAKKDEIEILNRELKSKRKKGVIGIGAMSDTYNPFEKQYEITRQSLELISYYNFGVSIETKSNLIVRDIDIFNEINKKADIILKFTITSADDDLSRKIEPGVCVSSERLKAMKELQKIENYIEQALYYARSNTVEKDYYVKKANLKDIVNESIKKNKNVLIHEKISVNVHDLDLEVNTDNKWIIFILNQIIQNSIKYKKQDKNLEIEIYAKQGKENVILYIKDNGIGIKKGEITRVFEKGFTGTNGRLIGKKSTGIGLYLCKNLCNKLGIAIELNSVQDKGTEIRLVFPKSSYLDIQ